MKDNFEILAPAGSFAALEAAIKAGANAIYLGGKKFSARSKAQNFTDNELKDAVIYAHLRNVKIYVVINILLDNAEIKEALEFTNFLYSIGVDGIIVQDLGYGVLIRKIFKDLEIHASTQMAINNLWGAKFVENLGFNRVVLARETSLDEIESIRDKTNLDIEGFIHGALCVCFSGECIMSSMIGARSGNRGDCAQPCRKSYDILDRHLNKVADKKYFLSPKDLNLQTKIYDYINKGVYSLKIEGRMKKPEYVYKVVSSYKKAILGKLTEKDVFDTTKIFSRGFTNGLFYGDFGRAFSSYDRPDNRGLLIGEIKSKNKDKYYVSLSEDIEVGDGIEITKDNFSYGFVSRETIKNNGQFSSNKKIPIGALIFKNYSKLLFENLQKEIRESRTYRPLNIIGKFVVGKNPKLILKTEDLSISYELDKRIEKAIKNPVSMDRIKENLTKLNDTIYYVESIELEVDKDIFIPISLINELRREAIHKLNEKILKSDRKLLNIYDAFLDIPKLNSYINKTSINVEVESLKDLEKIDLSKVDRIYLSINRFDAKIIAYLRLNKMKVGIVLNKFESSQKTLENLDYLLKNKDIVKEVLINNWGQVHLFKDSGFDLVGDIGLNIFNSYTVYTLLNMGFKRLILSLELNKNQIINITKDFGEKIEVVCHGFVPVMTMLHCPMAIELNCKDSSHCKNCKWAIGFFLKDFKNEKFLVKREENFSEIFNCHPIMLGDKIKNLNSYGVKNFKINLFDDISTIDLYFDILNNGNYLRLQEELKKKFIKKYNNITYGHYNRGIL